MTLGQELERFLHAGEGFVEGSSWEGEVEAEVGVGGGGGGGLKRSLGMRPTPWDSKKAAGEGGWGGLPSAHCRLPIDWGRGWW
jgi:hypothetical protein